MSYISGRTGNVKVGETPKAIVEMTEWSLTLDNDIEELTMMGSAGWKDKMLMMTGWSGSCKGYLDLHDVTETGQQDIMNSLLGTNATLAPTDLDLRFYSDVTGTKYYRGATATIKSMKVSSKANGLAEVEFEFEGKGTLTWNTS